MPIVSIVIPTYNRANLIEQTIESALYQSYQDFEIIVIDDGSTDNTLSILKKYRNRIQLVCQAHKGFGGAQARNFGIKIARGEFVAFLDSDDIWMPNKIERQMDLIRFNSHLAWVYSDAEVFDGDTGSTLQIYSQSHHLYQGDVLKYLLFDDFIPFSTTLVKRSVLKDVGGFISSIKGTDWDLNLRIASQTSIGLVPEPLARIRVHADRVTSTVSCADAFYARKAIIERAITSSPDKLSSLRNKALARIYIQSGQELAVSGKVVQARKMFIHAIRLMPNSAEAYVSLLGCMAGKPAFTAFKATRRWWRKKKAIYMENVRKNKQ